MRVWDLGSRVYGPGFRVEGVHHDPLGYKHQVPLLPLRFDLLREREKERERGRERARARERERERARERAGEREREKEREKVSV